MANPEVNDKVKIVSVPLVKDQLYIGMTGIIRSMFNDSEMNCWYAIEVDYDSNIDFVTLSNTNFKIIPPLPTKREVLLGVLKRHSLDEAHNTMASSMSCMNVIEALMQSDQIQIVFDIEVAD